MYFFQVLVDFVAGAGGSEESGPVTVCRNQPDEGGETGTVEKS